ILQLYLAVKFPIFPVAYWESFAHTILPTIALSVFVTANVARFSRTELIEVMNSEYIVTAKAKGISQVGVIIKHAL
ncbi:peptide ABC transporter permease, partial [Pseudomonas sp. FW305-BF6]|uniref:ABC transporter permease subunit n=1 Tax=Pseudomonas sp. FW305-BF6 TaxID=2070673 RepID=UPI000CB63493